MQMEDPSHTLLLSYNQFSTNHMQPQNQPWPNSLSNQITNSGLSSALSQVTFFLARNVRIFLSPKISYRFLPRGATVS